MITEKDRRAYYQDIVYAVCNALDRIDGKKPGTGTVCGTVEEPSQEVQIRVGQLVSEVKRRNLKLMIHNLGRLFDPSRDVKLDLIRQNKIKVEFVRVGGDAICPRCGCEYREHPEVKDDNLLMGCDGTLLKT